MNLGHDHSILKDIHSLKNTVSIHMYEQSSVLHLYLKGNNFSGIKELFVTIRTLVFPFAQINVGKIIAGNSFIGPESKQSNSVS